MSLSDNDYSEDDYSEDDYSEDKILTKARTRQFWKLLYELEYCKKDEQMQKIEEMKRMMDEMNKKELKSVFTKELFNKFHQMIGEKTLSLDRVILLLKHVIYFNIQKRISINSFDESLLCKRMRRMMNDENEKKKEMNEKLLVDLCECSISLSYNFSGEVLSICVPCLLKASSNKEENEETQKEVEMALFALSYINRYFFIEQELYLDEIKEIIEYFQEHQDLTQFAYQSAWEFLINRFFKDKSLEEVIVNELHFAIEARRELEKLSKCIDWKKKEEENGRIEVSIIRRWLRVIKYFFVLCTLWNEELAGLLYSIVQLFRASRGNHKNICYGCLDSLRCAAENRNVEVDDLLKSGAIGLYLEEMKQSTLDDRIVWNGLNIFLNISERLKEKTDGETDETKRKELKRKIFERMEEEGYEDAIISFHEIFYFLTKTILMNYR